MKVVLKSTTNEHFKFLEGKEGDINIGLVLSFNFEPDENTPFEMRRGDFRSSIILAYTNTELSQGCYEFKFTTKNSEYIFVYGVYNKNKPPFTKEEEMELALAFTF